MSFTFNRRKFVGASLLASTAVIGPSALSTLLGHRDASGQVFALLKEHLHLAATQRAVADAFTLSLLTTAAHSQSPAEFNDKVRRIETREDLARYVVQEFVVSTNYLAYASGQAPTLALVKGGKDVRGQAAARGAFV